MKVDGEPSDNIAIGVGMRQGSMCNVTMDV